MIILTSTLQTLKWKLGESATTQLKCYASYTTLASPPVPNSQTSTSNNTTDVTLLSAPGSGKFKLKH